MKTKYTVSGLSCQKCADSLTRALSVLPEVKKVKVKFAKGLVTIVSDEELAEEKVRNAVTGAGYQFGGKLAK